MYIDTRVLDDDERDVSDLISPSNPLSGLFVGVIIIINNNIIVCPPRSVLPKLIIYFRLYSGFTVI